MQAFQVEIVGKPPLPEVIIHDRENFANHKNNETPNSEEFIEYKYRWVIVSLFGISTITNAIASSNIPPIANKLITTYGVSATTINAIAMIYLVVYTGINFPANYIIDSKGLRVGLMIGTIIFAIGSGIELLVNWSFGFVILGSLGVALGQPFIINSPAKVATFWFKAENRPLATSILTAINIVGSGFGFILPTLLVPEKSTQTQAKKDVFVLFFLEFLLACGCALAVAFFMRDKPPTPASKGAQSQKTPFKESVRSLIKNRNFRLLFLGFIFFYGTLLTFGSLVNLIFKPYGFQDIQIGLLGIGLLICGILGSIFVSLYVKKTTKYQFTFRTITSSSVIIMSITTAVLNGASNIGLTVICVSFIGFLVTPVMPLSYDLGCQIAFPAGEALVTGILNGGGMIFSFFLIFFLDLIIGFGTKQQSLAILITFISLMGTGLFFYWIVKPELNRRNHESGVQGVTPRIDEPINDARTNRDSSTNADERDMREEVKEEKAMPYDVFRDERL